MRISNLQTSDELSVISLILDTLTQILMVKPCLQKILSNKECCDHNDCVHTILADYWFYQFNEVKS